MPQPTETKRSKATRLSKLSKLAKVAVDALEDLKGQDIKVLDVQKLTTVTDTMIVCTGTSNRHVKSLAQNVAEDAKKAGFRPLGVEGGEAGEWVLVDLGGVVVHVMQAQARAFYQLEKLWTIEDEEAAPAPKPKKAAVKKAGAQKAGTKKAAAKKTGAKASAGTRKAGGLKAPAKTSTAAKKTARKAPAKKAAPRKSAPRR